MFTGIIESVMPVLSARKHNGSVAVQFKKPSGWKLMNGQSIAIDGICSTVVAHKNGYFVVSYMPITLAKTTVVDFTKSRLVNLERSLTFGKAIDGHIIQGHVDARGRVTKIKEEGGVCAMTVRFPPSLLPFVTPQGSIAINGVSLTVANRDSDLITVGLIPYTLSHTNLGSLTFGSAVNIEVDTLARYAVAALSAGSTLKPHAKKAVRKRTSR